MANKGFSRKHPNIGRSAMQRLDPQARTHLTHDQKVTSFISDAEWVNHRHKLVGEALRGLHHVCVDLDDINCSPSDLAAMHAVISEFVLILCSEMDDAVQGLRSLQGGPAAT